MLVENYAIGAKVWGITYIDQFLYWICWNWNQKPENWLWGNLVCGKSLETNPKI